MKDKRHFSSKIISMLNRVERFKEREKGKIFGYLNKILSYNFPSKCMEISLKSLYVDIGTFLQFTCVSSYPV